MNACVCTECGHATADAYAVNPVSGRVEQLRRWCRACYEAIHARRARERYRPDEKEELYATH